MTARAMALLVAGLGSGVTTGVLFAFSTFVMPGLAKLSAAQGAAAMQAINVAAINVPFMTVLLGSGALAAGIALASPSRAVIAGAALYLVGVLAVTMLANVPRNDALAASAAYWPRYLPSWCAWNHVRTAAAALATACFLFALSGCYTAAGIDRCADVPAAKQVKTPATLAETGFETAHRIEYRPRFELWSDGASKRRFLALPPNTTIDTSDMDAWRFPRGTKLWKEFSRQGAVVEMRYLEKIGNEDGDWVAMSYVDGRATPDGQRTLGVPAARECLGCHGGVRDRVLGVSAVQLDAATIATLASDNRFTRDVREAKLPGDARDVAALGYLHANCAHCHNQHRPASTGPRCYDPRAKMDLALRTTDLARVEHTAAWRTTSGNVITPGDAEGSELYRRLAGSGFEPRMPAIGTRDRDPAGIAAVSEWIRAMPR